MIGLPYIFTQKHEKKVRNIFIRFDHGMYRGFDSLILKFKKTQIMKFLLFKTTKLYN